MIAAVDGDSPCLWTGEKEVAQLPAADPTFVSSNSLEGKGLSLKTLTSLNQTADIRTRAKQPLPLLPCPARMFSQPTWALCERRRNSIVLFLVTLRKHLPMRNHGVWKHLGSKGSATDPGMRSPFALELGRCCWGSICCLQGFNSLLFFCKVPCFFNLGKQLIEVRLGEHLCHTKESLRASVEALALLCLSQKMLNLGILDK